MSVLESLTWERVGVVSVIASYERNLVKRKSMIEDAREGSIQFDKIANCIDSIYECLKIERRKLKLLDERIAEFS